MPSPTKFRDQSPRRVYVFISSRALRLDIQTEQELAPLLLDTCQFGDAAFSAVNSKQLQIKLRENIIKLSLVFLRSENLTFL